MRKTERERPDRDGGVERVFYQDDVPDFIGKSKLEEYFYYYYLLILKLSPALYFLLLWNTN